MTPLAVGTVKYNWILWQMKTWKYIDVDLATLLHAMGAFGSWQVINFHLWFADIVGNTEDSDLFV